VADKRHRIAGSDPFSVMESLTKEIPRDALIPIDDGYQLFDVVIHETGIEFPEEMEVNEWEEFGRYLLRLDTSLTWALIDWLIYGDNRKWGETYQKVADDFGLKVDSLYVYISDGRKILIRNKDLSFAHHRQVTRLSFEDQEYWLMEAVKNRWTVKQLRDAIVDRPTPPVIELYEKRFSRLETFMNKQSLSEVGEGERKRLADKLRELADRLEGQQELGLIRNMIS
jgi:hypothetical protein